MNACCDEVLSPLYLSRLYNVGAMMTVNLTADHRHINGDVAATFLKTLKAVIEDPKDLVY